MTLASCIERGEAVPPAVLFAALSCALAFVPPRTRCFGLLAPVVAFLVSRLPVPPAWIEILFIGCWVSIAGTAALVHVRGGGVLPAAALAVNAGAWAGARGWSIAVKVVSSG